MRSAKVVSAEVVVVDGPVEEEGGIHGLLPGEAKDGGGISSEFDLGWSKRYLANCTTLTRNMVKSPKICQIFNQNARDR
jgi:hypothetical protein